MSKVDLVNKMLIRAIMNKIEKKINLVTEILKYDKIKCLKNKRDCNNYYLSKRRILVGILT